MAAAATALFRFGRSLIVPKGAPVDPAAESTLEYVQRPLARADHGEFRRIRVPGCAAVPEWAAMESPDERPEIPSTRAALPHR